MDALDALRDAIQQNKPITYTNNDKPCSSLAEATAIQLSSKSFPKETLTRLRKANAPTTTNDPETEPDSFHRLDAVLLVWLLRERGVTEYMQSARSHQLLGALVSSTRRKTLVEWLEGASARHTDIAPLQSKP
jgi:parafibromin